MGKRIYQILCILFSLLIIGILQAQQKSKALHNLSKKNSKFKIKWEKRLPMPGPLYAFDAVTIGNRIYAIGGRGGKEGYAKYNYIYDLQADKWEILKELIYNRSNHAVAAVNNKIYVFGGNESPDRTEVYDPQKNTWTELADMPTPRQHINYSAASVNRKIYVIGGIEKRSERDYIITSKNEEYDPATNTWTEKAPLPSPRQVPAVVSWQDKIYVISGTDNKWDDQSTVFVYHPRDDTWETKAQMPEARYINGVAVVKEKIIVLTGKRSDTKISKIFEYDPETDQWHYLGELPLNFMLAGVTAANDKLYVLGGSTHEHILSTCWQTNFSFTSNRLKGPYFRLKPPGMTPEIFAPGFISTKEYEEQRCIFSPDGTECYFVRRGEYPKTRIMVTRVQQEGWSKPKPVSFSSESSESMQVLTPDGSRMFFNSNRPLPGTTKENRRGIWFVERTHEGWGQPQYFGYGSQVTVAKNGTLYYRDPNNYPRDSLSIRRFQNGKYSKPEVLKIGVGGNRPGHPWIAPDESYILFDTWHPEGQGKGEYPDFYVCFRKKDGSWGEAINLGDSINKELHNNVCSISPDGKYFFYSYEGDIYWVSMQVIEKLKHK